MVNINQAVFDFIANYNRTHVEKISLTSGIENHCQTVQNPIALDLHFPNSIAVSEFMAMTHTLKLKNPEIKPIIRPAAGGMEDKEKPSESYSLSGLIDGDIIIRLTGREFDSLDYMPEEKAEYVQDAQFVYRVGTNKRMWHLDEELYEARGTHGPDRRPNPAASLGETSLIDTITPGGWGTGPHGQSLKHSNLNSFLHAVTRCRADGVIERIQRNGTIERFNPNTQMFELSEEKYPFTNILFGTNLGMFGIILNVEIECEPAYDLHCIIEKCNVAQLIHKMEKENLFRKDDFTHFMIPPTYDADELSPDYKTKNVIIFRSNKIAKGSKSEAGQIGPSGGAQKALNAFSDFFNLGSFLDFFPSLIPIFNKYFVTRIEISDQGEETVGPSYKILHYLKNYPRKIRDISLFVPDDGFCSQFVKSIRRIYNIFKDAIFKKEKPVSKVIFGRRIHANHDGGLSTSSVPVDSPTQDIAAIDCVTDRQIRTFDTFLQKFYDDLADLNAKPHWGKEWPKFEIQAVYGEGYLEFLSALLYEQCADMAEFNSYVVDPTNKAAWDRVLKKIIESPFINFELDRILKLNKYSVEERQAARTAQAASPRKSSFLEHETVLLKKFKADLHEFDPSIQKNAHGMQLVTDIGKLYDKHASSVKNSSSFVGVIARTNSEAKEADVLIAQEQKQQNAKKPWYACCK